ncbi:uncharacterized protein [Chiloscyllium punctatum]|uniref:uncharacterized protein n=1 Tax=Chiloscyllium punctatum TaxID=137246 RepID=UPI003B6420A7
MLPPASLLHIGLITQRDDRGTRDLIKLRLQILSVALHWALKFPPAASGVLLLLGDWDRDFRRPFGYWATILGAVNQPRGGSQLLRESGVSTHWGKRKDSEIVRSRLTRTCRMEVESHVQSETALQPLKDHCDYLMDSIDAQLSQLQVSVLTDHRWPAASSLTKRDPFRSTTKPSGKTGTLNTSQSGTRDTGLGSASGTDALSDTEELISIRQEGNSASECEGALSRSEDQDVTAMFNLSPDFRRSQSNITLTEFARPGAAAGGESRKDQYEWRVQQLLGPQHMEFQQYQSDTNTVDSIRTEDFALRFHEGMVDPALNFDAEPDSEQNSFVSRSASCSEHSLEYACLESNTQPGNLARKVCGRPWKQRLFRREASNTECAQLDCTAKQGCCGVVTETSARIHLAQSLTGAEQDESVGNVIPRCDQGSAGVDGPVNSVAQRVNDVQQFQEDLEHALQRTRDQAGTLRRQQANSKALTRRTESVESLGGRISKLSQFNLSELSLQRRTFLSKNRIQVANQCRESNRLTGNGLETSSSPVSDLGVLTQEDRGTNLASTGIKMKGLQKSQAESPERHSGGHNPELQGLSKEGTGNWRPMEQESSTPNDMPLSPKLEDNQQDAVTVNMNRTPSPCHMIPTLGPCCTQSVSSSPAHLSGSFNYSGKTNTSGQWHRITSAPSAFESQFLESEGCQAAAVSLSGSVPLSMGHAWKGDCDSKLVSCHDSDVAHSAFHSRRRVYLSQGKQTDAINVTEVRRTHVRSNTDGAYREELRSHGLGNFRVKPTSRRTASDQPPIFTQLNAFEFDTTFDFFS